MTDRSSSLRVDQPATSGTPSEGPPQPSKLHFPPLHFPPLPHFSLRPYHIDAGIGPATTITGPGASFVAKPQFVKAEPEESVAEGGHSSPPPPAASSPPVLTKPPSPVKEPVSSGHPPPPRPSGVPAGTPDGRGGGGGAGPVPGATGAPPPSKRPWNILRRSVQTASAFKKSSTLMKDAPQDNDKRPPAAQPPPAPQLPKSIEYAVHPLFLGPRPHLALESLKIHTPQSPLLTARSPLEASRSPLFAARSPRAATTSINGSPLSTARPQLLSTDGMPRSTLNLGALLAENDLVLRRAKTLPTAIRAQPLRNPFLQMGLGLPSGGRGGEGGEQGRGAGGPDRGRALSRLRTEILDGNLEAAPEKPNPFTLGRYRSLSPPDRINYPRMEKPSPTKMANRFQEIRRRAAEGGSPRVFGGLSPVRFASPDIMSPAEGDSPRVFSPRVIMGLKDQPAIGSVDPVSGYKGGGSVGAAVFRVVRGRDLLGGVVVRRSVGGASAAERLGAPTPPAVTGGTKPKQAKVGAEDEKNGASGESKVAKLNPLTTGQDRETATSPAKPRPDTPAGRSSPVLMAAVGREDGIGEKRGVDSPVEPRQIFGEPESDSSLTTSKETEVRTEGRTSAPGPPRTSAPGPPRTPGSHTSSAPGPHTRSPADRTSPSAGPRPTTTLVASGRAITTAPDGAVTTVIDGPGRAWTAGVEEPVPERAFTTVAEEPVPDTPQQAKGGLSAILESAIGAVLGEGPDSEKDLQEEEEIVNRIEQNAQDKNELGEGGPGGEDGDDELGGPLGAPDGTSSPPASPSLALEALSMPTIQPVSLSKKDVLQDFESVPPAAPVAPAATSTTSSSSAADPPPSGVRVDSKGSSSATTPGYVFLSPRSEQTPPDPLPGGYSGVGVASSTDAGGGVYSSSAGALSSADSEGVDTDNFLTSDGGDEEDRPARQAGAAPFAFYNQDMYGGRPLAPLDENSELNLEEAESFETKIVEEAVRSAASSCSSSSSSGEGAPGGVVYGGTTAEGGFRSAESSVERGGQSSSEERGLSSSASGTSSASSGAGSSVVAPGGRGAEGGDQNVGTNGNSADNSAQEQATVEGQEQSEEEVPAQLVLDVIQVALAAPALAFEKLGEGVLQHPTSVSTFESYIFQVGC